MADLTAEKPPSKTGLLFKTIICIILLDRWFFKPMAAIAAHKGPFFVFGKSPNKKGAKKKR